MPVSNIFGVNSTFDIEDDLKRQNPIAPVSNRGIDTSLNPFGNIRPSSTDSFDSYMLKLNTPKREIDTWSGLSREDSQVELSDGTYIDKYDEGTYYAGLNNAEIHAEDQSKGNKWKNGLLKFGGKTLNAIVGGTVGVVNGVGEAVSQGSWDALYDNEFSNRLADLDTKMNYQLPNYYSQQESQKNLWGQAGTANFWADKVLGGLSFTLGAIVSEGIWSVATGGTSAATLGARWGVKAMGFTRVAEGLASNKAIIKELAGIGNVAMKTGEISKDAAIIGGKIGDLARTGRFMWTSAGFESGQESLHYKKEAKENFLRDFESLNGRSVQAEDIENFETNLSDAANAVFATNMAIVGSSNLVMMGKILEVKNPIKTGFQEFIEKKAFGVGIEKTTDTAGKTLYKTLEASRAQKIARNVFHYGKPLVTEGLYEEGLQGVTSTAAGKWIQHTYDPKAINETADMSGLLYDSFAQQYGSNEGWTDIGVGMIIGALGGNVEARAEMRETNDKVKYQQASLNTFQEKALAERFLLMNRLSGFSAESKTEEAKGNIVNAMIANDAMLHSFMNSKYQLGESLQESVDTMSQALNSVTPEQWTTAGISEQDVDAYKKQSIQEFADVARQFRQNRKFAEYMIGKGKIVGESAIYTEGLKDENGKTLDPAAGETLIQALTWNLTAGENANTLMQAIFGKIKNQATSAHLEALKANEMLKATDEKLSTVFYETQEQLKQLQVEQEALERELVKIQNAKKPTEGDTQTGDRYGEVSSRLLDLEDKLTSVQNQRDTTWEQIQQQNKSRRAFGNFNPDEDVLSDNVVYSYDLDNLEKNLKEFQTFVNTTNNQYLKDLLKEYNDAQTTFLANQKTALMLSGGRANVKQINNWLSGFINRKKPMDEATRDWLVETLQNYQKNKLATAEGILPVVEAEVIDSVSDEIENTGNIPDAVLQNIATKVKNGLPLTEGEKTIFEDKETEITEIAKQIPVMNLEELYNEEISQQTTPELTPEQQSRKKEIEDRLERLEKEGIAEDKKQQTVLLNFLGSVDLNKPYSVEQIGEMLKKLSATREIREIHRLIEKAAKDLGVTVSFNFSTENIDTKTGGYYQHVTHGIAVNLSTILAQRSSPSALAEIIVHEMVHGVTGYMVEAYAFAPNDSGLTKAQDNAVQNLAKIHANLKENKKFDNKYGNKNLHELLAGLTNKSFSTLLQTTKDKEGLLGEVLSLFGRNINQKDNVTNVLKEMVKNPDISTLRSGSDLSGDTSELWKEQALISDVITARENKIPNLKEYVELSNELRNLNTQTNLDVNFSAQRTQLRANEPLQATTELEALKARVERMLQRQFHSITYIGDTYDGVADKKPTKEEIDEYKELSSKTLTNEEIPRLNYLTEKLGNWKMLDSVVEDNRSIADIVDIIQQLEAEIEEDNTIEEIDENTANDIAQTNSVGDKQYRPDLAQNVKASATVRKNSKNNTVSLSHIKLTSLYKALGIPLERITTGKKGKAVTEQQLLNPTPRTIFSFDNIKVVIEAGGVLTLSANDFTSIQAPLNIWILPSENYNWSYTDLYEKVGDEYQKRPSDFTEETFPELLYEIKPGDELGFEIANDDWNASLEGKSKETIRQQLKIYVTYKGKAVSILKAMGEAVTNDEFTQLRNTAADLFIAGNYKLQATVKAQKLFIGSPQVIAVENGNGGLKTEFRPIDKTAAKQIVATGYVQNGQTTLNRKVGDVDLSYTSNIKDSGKKIPVIIIKKGAYNIAYPVSMVKTNVDLSGEIKNIVDNPALNTTEKVKAINERIIARNIAMDKRLSTYNEEQIQEVMDVFEANMEFTPMSTFSSASYKTESVQNDVLINIDLNNLDKVISDGKIELNLGSIQIASEKVHGYDRLTSVEDQLNDYAYELYRDYVDNANTKYLTGSDKIIDNTKYTNIFDDNPIEKATSSRQKLRNINILGNALSSKPTTTLSQIIGKDKLAEIDKLLKERNAIKKQISVTSKNIVSGKKNSDC